MNIFKILNKELNLNSITKWVLFWVAVIIILAIGAFTVWAIAQTTLEDLQFLGRELSAKR